jgi:hypothetical protein
MRLVNANIDRRDRYDHAQPGVDKAVVQALVRRKLKHHQLPGDRAVAIREFGRFSSDGRQCDACDERIGANQQAVLVMVSLKWMSVFFHVGCYEIWDAERPRFLKTTATAEAVNDDSVELSVPSGVKV